MLYYGLSSPIQGVGCQADQGNTFRVVATLRDGQSTPFQSAIHINSTFVFRSVHHQFPVALSSTLFFCLSFSFFLGRRNLLRMISTLFAAGLLLLPSANAFFRLPCAKPVLNARVDPIISKGVPSGHSHTIMGANGALHRKIITQSQSDFPYQPSALTPHLTLCVNPTAPHAKSRTTSLRIGSQSWYVASLRVKCLLDMIS